MTLNKPQGLPVTGMGREKRCSERGFDVSESRPYQREGMLPLRATCTLPFFFHLGKPGELTLLSVLPELSRSLGLGEQELQVVRASGK